MLGAATEPLNMYTSVFGLNRLSLLSEIFPASCRLKITEEIASQVRFVIRCICLSPFKKIDVSVEEERVFRKFVADKKGVTFY